MVWLLDDRSTTYDSCIACGRRAQIKYLRALQGHSRLLNRVQILYEWMVYIHPVGSTWDNRSVVDAGLLAGGEGDNQGRHTCFFASVNPVCEFDDESNHMKVENLECSHTE